MTWRRSPRQVGAALDGVRDDLAPATLLAEVQQVWREAVGSAIAGEAQPTSERGGALVVSCSASVWAQELDLMAPAILASLNQALGAERITRLRCTTVPLADGQAHRRA